MKILLQKLRSFLFKKKNIRSDYEQNIKFSFGSAIELVNLLQNLCYRCSYGFPTCEWVINSSWSRVKLRARWNHDYLFHFANTYIRFCNSLRDRSLLFSMKQLIRETFDRQRRDENDLSLDPMSFNLWILSPINHLCLIITGPYLFQEWYLSKVSKRRLFLEIAMRKKDRTSLNSRSIDVTFVFLPENVSAVSSHPAIQIKLTWTFSFFFKEKEKEEEENVQRSNLTDVFTREIFLFLISLYFWY